MARYIDVLTKEEKKVERRSKVALGELGAVMAEVDRVKKEGEAARRANDNLAKKIENLKGERRKLDGEIVNLTQAADGIRRSHKRDPDLAEAMMSTSAEDLYASMKPDKYGVAVYHVKNANFDRWFLKMRWGNNARIIAEGTEEAVCKIASDIIKLTHGPGATIRAIRVTDKKALWDTKDC